MSHYNPMLPKADWSPIGGVVGDKYSISEFADKVIQLIIKSIYDPMYESVNKQLAGIFDSLNMQINRTRHLMYGGPKAWNGSAFSIMQAVSETVAIPIAAVFITVIFCWELIHLVQENNAGNDIKPEKLMIILLKFGLCLMVCAHSFEIVMAFCDVGNWASRKIAGITTTEISGFTLTLTDLGVPAPPLENYEFGKLMELFGYKIILAIGWIAIFICGLIVYIRVMLWFVELLLYASVSAIPYSTWMNKEWSQVGMNYTRKMLALSFEGFFMLLLYAVYGGVMGGLRYGDFTANMVMVIGSGFALGAMMFKVGNISASIFNAH